VSERTQVRRQGRGGGLRELLVERDWELAALERRLAGARDGAGGVVLIEAPAGKGKSRLLTVAGDMAREAGMQVLGARGTRLERDFPFGVAIRLFEPRWVAANEDQRAAMLEGPARLAGALLQGGLPDAAASHGDEGYPLIHGLFWMACNLASGSEGELTGAPLVLLADDAQWADRPSLRFLAYLAERLGNLPIVLIVGMRPGEVSGDPPAVMALRNAPDGTVLRPRSLSDAGVEEVVLAEFPDADRVFVSAGARVTHGNPFLLVELLAQLRADGEAPDAATAYRLRGLAPDAVLNSVLSRLGAMPDVAGAVASAVAVLGDGAALEQVARLTELDVAAISEAADTLAATHMFHAGAPLSFVHPLIGSAVERSMSPLARARAHRHAAVILTEEGAPAEAVAAHLLAALPEADPGAVETLRAVAEKALVTGAPRSAVRLLERALAEQPEPDVRRDVLAKLGKAEAEAGLPHAGKRLADEIRITDEPQLHAGLALAHGRALYTQGRYRDAAAALDAPLDQLNGGHDELADELEAAYVSAASLTAELASEARARRQKLLARLTDQPTVSQRAALAHAALQDSLSGASRSEIRQLAELAWGDGALLDAEGADPRSWTLLPGALLFVDELERAIEICDAALADARRRHSPLAYATASYCRAGPLYEQGRVIDALADAQAALNACHDSRPTDLRSASGALVLCHLQRGQLEEAEAALTTIQDPPVRDSPQHAYLLDVRAQLRLAQQRPQEALADATQAGKRLESDFGAISPGAIAWRSTAALAHLASGNSDVAKELAADELDHARRIDVPRVMIRDLRILGLAERGQPGIDLLREAVDIGKRYSSRLEHIHALIDLGGALRRANHRADAREPLRKGAELSYRGGATALAYHAQTELAAAGARPRRVMLSGVASLTPSERRVADLAAHGLTTRQIAQALFVTPKTVEYHLRHTYQKLDISSRTQLTEALPTALGQ
jgi:DNA-binding CsgD family transcriptional regulator/tetratricopeptide (TPR) repeat protein